MTTSGTSTFTYNRDQIIRRALRIDGAIQAGETPGAQIVTDAADALNAMVKELDATGIHVWTETEGILYLQPNQVQYGLGGSSTDNASQSSIQTSLSANVSQGAITLPLTSAAGILNGDNIGVALPSGGIFWTT